MYDDKKLAAEQKEKRRSQQIEEANIDTAIDALTQHTAGRQFLWWLMAVGKVDMNTFTGHALSGSFQQGEQNVGLQIKARIMEASPDGFISMLKENLENARGNNDSTGAGDDDGDDYGPTG